MADALLFFACRQAQDKLSDVAAQAQARAQELAHDVSNSKKKPLCIWPLHVVCSQYACLLVG